MLYRVTAAEVSLIKYRYDTLYDTIITGNPNLAIVQSGISMGSVAGEMHSLGFACFSPASPSPPMAKIEIGLSS
jgi:hypothetical protein